MEKYKKLISPSSFHELEISCKNVLVLDRKVSKILTINSKNRDIFGEIHGRDMNMVTYQFVQTPVSLWIFISCHFNRSYSQVISFSTCFNVDHFFSILKLFHSQTSRRLKSFEKMMPPQKITWYCRTLKLRSISLIFLIIYFKSNDFVNQQWCQHAFSRMQCGTILKCSSLLYSLFLKLLTSHPHQFLLLFTWFHQL